MPQPVSNRRPPLAAVGALALVLGLTGVPAFAQGPTKSLGSGTSTGRLLTRDELRACLQQQTALNQRNAEIGTQRTALDKEREAIAADQAALQDERAAIERHRQALEALRPRLEAFQQRSQDWRARVAAYNESDRTGLSAESQKRQLDREQQELLKEQQALEAERNRLTGTAEEAARAYGARAGAVDARATDWNQRNGRLAEAQQALADDRQGWIQDCGNRRYREDDEKALRAGP